MNFDEFLRHPHPFLTGMCESHLHMLADHATHVHFPAGGVPKAVEIVVAFG